MDDAETTGQRGGRGAVPLVLVVEDDVAVALAQAAVEAAGALTDVLEAESARDQAALSLQIADAPALGAPTRAAGSRSGAGSRRSP